MQHRYVGDVGDFGKYALLNALAASGLRLGVIWYLNERPEKNSDGKFTAFEHLASLAPDLFHKLSTIRENVRRLERVEVSKVFPENTLFAGKRLPYPNRPCYSSAEREIQQRLRHKWFENAVAELFDTELVFLDPDNGIAAPSLNMHSTRACKYVFACEVEALLASGRSVVLYQHQHRIGTLKQQVEKAIQRFSQASTEAFAITSHAFSVRAYLILPANTVHARMLDSQTKRFLNSKWSTVFRPAYPNR